MDRENPLKKALALFENNRYADCRIACTRILKQLPEDLAAIHLLARCELQLNLTEKGLLRLGQVAARAPDNPQLMIEIGNAFRLAKRHSEALRYLNRALKLGSNEYAIHLELAFSYKGIDDQREAEAHFAQALNLNPSSWDAARNLSRIYRARGEVEAAKDLLCRYSSLQPGNPHAYAELAMLELARADPRAALDACEDALKAEPAYTRGFALKCIALNELDKREELDYLFDPEKMVRRVRGETPSSFKSMSQFCKHLARHILSHPNLTKNTGDYLGAVNGYHTGYEVLFKNSRELGARVERMILTAVEEYRARLSELDPTHPLRISMPTSYRIKSWAVVTEFNGFAAPHIHPTSWIGGSFYVQLPQDFKQQPTKKAGWIEFGRGEPGMHQLREPVTVSYEPIVGDFVIFPGYFWHNTVPLESTQKRICMAFDVEPVGGWGR